MTCFPSRSGFTSGSLLLACLFALLSTSLSAQAADESSGCFVPAASEADLDLAQCQAFVAGKAVPVKKGPLLSILGLDKEPNLWTVPRSKEERGGQFEVQYLVVFKQPVPAGLLAVGCVSGKTKVRYLAGASAAKIDLKSAAKWLTIDPQGLLAPKTMLKALLVTNTTDRDKSELQQCLIFKERLASLTQFAIGSGEKAPFGSNPDAIPQGYGWRNTGMDSSPGAVQRLQRGGVSTALPSWYILSWDGKQKLSGVILESNAGKFELFSYVGDPRANPALAGPKDWKRLPFESRFNVFLGGNDKIARRYLELQPVSTAAIKLEMTDCGGTPIAAIDRFDALQLLGDAAAPSSAPAAPSPFAIKYEQPFAGQMAMVIEDAQGRRVRNLVAQVERTPGEQIEGWDLKDEAGITVPPGEYKFKVLTAPPLELKFALTAIPTAPTLSGNVPWQRGESGPDGWLADHATHTSGIACGDKIYFGAPGVESGVSFIECNLQGHKLWAKHSFAGFTGLKKLASDGEAVYIYERDFLERFEPATHEIKPLATLISPTRKGEPTSLAAYKGQVYLSFHGQVPMMDNATLAGVIDLENSMPKYPRDIPDVLGNRRVQPNPRLEFLRLLRLAGTPSGQPGNFNPTKRSPHFPIFLESSSGSEKYQFICIAFNEPVPLGSVVFPTPTDGKVELFTLKADAKYPPDLRSTKDWTPFAPQPTAGWECLAAPENTLTRALLVRFTKQGVDEEGSDVLDLLAEKEDAPSLPDDLDSLKPKADLLGEGKKSDWFGRLEGMKLLRRRFQNLTPTATVRVNSGEINKQGEWDAKRSAPITPEEPGIYVMEWKTPQQVAGLAIKEIDGAKTMVDVWTGDDNAEINLDGEENWREVAEYQQARRDSYEPAFERNSDARYIDGYVDFHGNIATRAVRLRVVEQWADLGERGTATMRSDRGGRVVDARSCHIYGVSALEYIGGEAPVDAGVHQRIEVRDGKTGDLVRDLAGEVDNGLSFNPAGKLFGVRGGKVVQVDTKTGKSQDFLKLKADDQASGMTIDAAGFFYVVVQPRNVIDVFDPEGQFVRTIGKPGGQPLGHWDPLKFMYISDLFVATDKSLWVVEAQYLPRRIVQYKTDGTFVQELIGNTNYGGAGTLSRYDKSRLFQSGVEYAIDWKTGKTRIKSLLAHGVPADVLPIKIEDRLYLTSAPFSYQHTQPVASVYLVDDKTGLARLAAAFGEAVQFEPLKQGAVLALLEQGKALKDYRFLWSDTNGNGKVDAPEVQLEIKNTDQGLKLGRLDKTLACQAGQTRYEVSKYLPDGTPVYEKNQTAANGYLQLDNGNTLGQVMNSTLMNEQGEPKHETSVTLPDGSKLWAYGTEYESVSGLYVPPWKPGWVTNEFGIIGHETADKGDLGEFFVVHANNGQWKVWSADGLLAGNIMYHLGDPRSRSMQAYSSAKPGDKYEHLTGGQEHFHGHFTKSEADGKYYAVFGHNYISLLEVEGLDRFKRIEGTVTVGSDDVRRVRDWEAERARRVVKSNARLIYANAMADDEVPFSSQISNGTGFGMAYDQESLYLRWHVAGHGQLKNTGADFQRTFKTGAAVDFQMSTDPAADPSRTRPAQGDFRLLVTFVSGKPRVVLYQPVTADASPSEAWETRTEAGGTTKFDRVTLLKSAQVALNTSDPDSENYSYDVTVAVPLSAIGLKIEEGMQLKMDWGVLTTETGDAVRRRLYWSNELANGTTDEAIEARLEPQLWGTVRFQERSSDEQRLTDLVPEVGNKKTTKQGSDLLKEIEDDLK